MDNQEFYDRKITDLYQKNTKSGAIKDFCKRHGIQKHIVRNRAVELGVVQPMRKETNWSQQEIELLESHYHKTAQAIRQIFTKNGYSRTDTAITVKRKRLKLFIADADIYTAARLAGIMGVDKKVITRWIDKGWLKATRKGTDRTIQQGGDMYQITPKAVRDFIGDNVAIIDIRKIDKFWLVDLLINKRI